MAGKEKHGGLGGVLVLLQVVLVCGAISFADGAWVAYNLALVGAMGTRKAPLSPWVVDRMLFVPLLALLAINA